MRTRWSWAVLVAVAGLVVFAAVDALRSEGTTVARATGSTIAPDPASARLPRCTPAQMEASVEILGGQATAVVRNIGSDACHLAPAAVRITLEDREGTTFHLRGFPTAPVGGDFPSGSEQTTNFSELITGCRRRGPFRATVHVGQLSASRSELSDREVGCLGR
jgi:hypothetical protein